MTDGTGTRPFSTLGDQQLLDQTRRLAANQRGLEVHILDHLDEIDRRGLALRRGFSSLFDYAVRELRFTDAAAQRRIQTMRLCRRHGWVRAKLHSGELTLTAAAQLETAFAAAERQSRRAGTNAGQECCHDLPGLPASPGAVGDREGDACGARAGVATAAAMTASAAHGVAAVDQEARWRRDIVGRADRHTGSDRGTRSSDELAAQPPRDPREREDRHTGSDRGRRLSDESAAVDAGPQAAGSQPAGRSDSGAATAGAAPASTPVGVPDRWDSNTATGYAPPRAAPGRALRTGCAGDGPADTPVVPGASHAAAQHGGAGHADALPARLESGGGAAHAPAPSRAPGPAAPSSDQCPAAPLLPPASRAAPGPLPVVAPSAPRPTAALAPVPSRGDPLTQRSAGPASAAPLLHPRRQRELIEQAAGMTTRQVAGLLASAAPEVLPPRDTLRAVAPDRFTLKVSIDQECEQGLRQLKNLLSHVDPRMSWGELVARLVREALARHDPGGGRRRKRVGSTATSSRPEQTTTGDAPAAASAGGGSDDAPAPQRETAAARMQSGAATSPNAAPVRRSAPAPPAATPATGLRGHTPAPQDETAAARMQSGAATSPNAAPVRRSAPAPPAATPATGLRGHTPAPQDETAHARMQSGAATSPGAAPVRRSPAAPAATPATGLRGHTPAPQDETAHARMQSGAATSPGAAPVHSSAPAARTTGPLVPGTRAGDAASVTPDPPAAPEGQNAGAHVPCPATGLPAAGAVRMTVPAAPAGDAREVGPSASPGAPAAPQFTGGGATGGTAAAPVPPSAPPAPKFATVGPADGTGAAPVSPASPSPLMFAGGGPADGTVTAPVSPASPSAPKWARDGAADSTVAAPLSPGAPPAPELAGGVSPARGAGGAPMGASPQYTRDALRGPRRSPVRRPIPAAVRRHVWRRDGGRCRFRDPLTGRRCNSSHLLQIHHLLPVAEGGGPEPENLVLSCFAHHRMCHGYGPAPAAEPGR